MTDSPLQEYARLDPKVIAEELSTSFSGLSGKEAGRRLAEHGHNVLAETKERNVIVRFLLSFVNPLVFVLFFAAGISAYFGENVDAGIILGIILISVILDFAQSYSTERALEHLKESVRSTTTVLREGKQTEIATADVCPGDVLILSAGNVIPADARVLHAKDFFVNQSSITGESFPCEKTAGVVEGRDLPLSALANIAFAGTSVVSGSATALVLRTGSATEFGKVAAKLAERPQKSEFELGITHFGYFIMRIILLLVLFIFLFNSLIRHDFFQSFMFALAIAVGMTPELLPIIMSVTMTKGSLNMAKKGVLVKKLAAIPNFGAMDILCTDKTGTLTENSITLVTYTDLAGSHSAEVLRAGYLNSTFQTGIRNPLDAAVLSFRKVSIKGYGKVDEIPFDFQRKRMSVIVRKGPSAELIAKGAPEEIFSCCTRHREGKRTLAFGKAARKSAMAEYERLSGEGYRVLAVASRSVPARQEGYEPSDEHDLVFLGFLSFFDPPKKDVGNVLKDLHGYGLEVKVITGDNGLIAGKVCREIGLPVKGVLEGSEVDHLSDEALRARAGNVTIFSRFSPDQKNRVIRALRAGGHVVGYMGDGVNDAPSLKTADVGISVENAVDVAKDAADLVLTKKSLRVLHNGILEGRKTFANTMKYIMMALSSNFGNMFSAAGAILFLPFLPMLPIQILMNNLMYDFSQLTIPTDNVDNDWIRRPHRWDLSFIKKFMYVFGPLSSLFDFATFAMLFLLFRTGASVFQTAWFMESLATQVLVIHIIRTRKLPLVKSRASRYLVMSTLGIIALGWILPFTPLGPVFGFSSLPVPILLGIVGIVAGYLLLVEVVKRGFYRLVPLG